VTAERDGFAAPGIPASVWEQFLHLLWPAKIQSGAKVPPSPNDNHDANRRERDEKSLCNPSAGNVYGRWTALVRTNSIAVDNQSGTIQAITSDGTTAWTATVEPYADLIADFQGGLVVFDSSGIRNLDG